MDTAFEVVAIKDYSDSIQKAYTDSLTVSTSIFNVNNKNMDFYKKLAFYKEGKKLFYSKNLMYLTPIEMKIRNMWREGEYKRAESLIQDVFLVTIKAALLVLTLGTVIFLYSNWFTTLPIIINKRRSGYSFSFLNSLIKYLVIGVVTKLIKTVPGNIIHYAARGIAIQALGEAF